MYDCSVRGLLCMWAYEWHADLLIIVISKFLGEKGEVVFITPWQSLQALLFPPIIIE